MTELAIGPFGDNAHHGDVQNPWRARPRRRRLESGSGAAVAAGLAAGALGTDTGGSIRLPAACCGVVGLKATYGRVSRAGVMPLSWSYDHVGPLTRTVRDAAIMLGVIAGARPAGRAPPAAARAGLRGGARRARRRAARRRGRRLLRGRSRRRGAGRLAEAVTRSAGWARVVELRDPVPRSGPIVRVQQRDGARRERRDPLAPRSRSGRASCSRRSATGSSPGLTVSAYDYLQGQRLRARSPASSSTRCSRAVDVLATPTIPEPAPALAARQGGRSADVIARMGRFSRLTRPFNALGVPALACPAAAAPTGGPLALQLVGRPFDEATRAARWATPTSARPRGTGAGPPWRERPTR